MSKISIKKPYQRWLFGGVGFHNSEATMVPIMSKKFYNERVLKCFREISPTFSRVFAGYADWTREAMDRFADYYDETFRKSGTLIYMVPGRMPMPTSDFDLEEYCEKTAKNLKYLIEERGCTKIRYFCITNENSVGNTYAYLGSRPDVFAKYHDALYRAFRRNGVDVGLLATDCSEVVNYPQIKWAVENIDEITDDYCTHLYLKKYQPGELETYEYCKQLFSELTMLARTVQKRYILGEFGIYDRNRIGLADTPVPMCKDTSYAVVYPENDGIYAVAVVEMALSVLNSGTFACAFWTLFDYPDPFIRENGDTPEEKGRYEVARFSGHGLQIRYNKNGLIKWCDDEMDYGSRAALYTMGYMAKLFKKGSRVLECSWEDEYLRAGAITNGDGSASVCVINWENEKKTVDIELDHKLDRPFRRYDFSANDVKYNEFCDLQSHTEEIECGGSFSIELLPRSVTFLTTDYENRTPSAIQNVRIENGELVWDGSSDAEHCYYRVYCNGIQIASTVAESVEIKDTDAIYNVISVDKYGNAGVINSEEE